PCCRFHPAEVEVPHRPDFGTPCCLRPTAVGSALGSHLSRPHCVHCCYGPVTRDLPKGDLVDGLQDLGDFGHPRHPAIQTTGLLPLPWQVDLLLNTPVFTGRNCRKAGFPRYGSKAGLSDRAFPDRTSVKLAPSMPGA